MLKVVPIAQTVLNYEELNFETPYPLYRNDVRKVDELAEFAGRACYQSWDRPNPATAKNDAYLANILKQGHESVLEHASISFYVTGVSRSLTHELIRHRHLSFSELSQRYVDVGDAEFVVPPALRDFMAASGEDDTLAVEQEWQRQPIFDDVRQAYLEMVEGLTENTELKRKQIREAARALMPNATETKIVVTGNVRAWRDVLKKRYHVAADAEIREFATEVLRHLREFAPNSFQDIPDKPFGAE